MISYKAFVDELTKIAATGAIGKLLGPASRAGQFLTNHEHALDVAGLGILAAPSAVDLAHNLRDPNASRKEKIHNAVEVGGLGVLAAPGIAHMISKR